MIEEISIRNFRGISSLDAGFCRRFNVIVGENGVGKTALLEAIYMTLGHSPSLAWKLKQLRGFEGTFQGSPQQIMEAFIGDYFYGFDQGDAVTVILKGAANDTRTLTIGRGSVEATLPFSDKSAEPSSLSIPIQFTWIDANGLPHTVAPRISSAGLQIQDTGEQRPDFFGFFATQSVNATEVASRFSLLSRADRHRSFINLIASEYPWINDLNIEVVAGAPMLYASVQSQLQKVPLNSVSGAISRVVAILLAIIVRENGVVLVDEIENGIYYKHLASVWKSILALARQSGTQLFVTSHSAEALTALREAAGKEINDIAFWRLERASDSSIKLRQFSGEDFAIAIEYNSEVR